MLYICSLLFIVLGVVELFAMHLLYTTSDSCIQTRMFIERDREIERDRDRDREREREIERERERERGDEPGIGNKSSGCTGNSLRHGNEGLLYLGIDLGVSSEREEVSSMGTHLPRCTQQLGPVLRERARENSHTL